VIRLIEARQPLHIAMRVGTVMSILGTATGRAFAAVMPLQSIEQSMKAALGDAAQESACPSSNVDSAELAKAADEVRTYGVTRAVGRPIPGVNAFSAAAFDHDGEPVIVITALGHQDHFPEAWDSDAAHAVRNAAAEISSRLGWNRNATNPQ